MLRNVVQTFYLTVNLYTDFKKITETLFYFILFRLVFFRMSTQSLDARKIILHRQLSEIDS